MVTMLVATSGGHLTQLHLLRPRIVDGPVLWVTDRTAQSESVLGGEDVVLLPVRPSRDYAGIVKDTAALASVFRSRRIDHVYSTGAQMALAALVNAKRHRVPFSYIESGTRVSELSATGRIIDRVRGVQRYVQYPFAANTRWKYALSVFDGFAPVERDALPLEAPRVVVSVGGNANYGFDRLIRHLAGVIPREWPVLWQVGPAEVDDLGLDTVRSLPNDVLRSEIERADVVISHAGTGSILTALSLGKLPIVVPRRASHGEHVDGHQDDLADYVSSVGRAMVRAADAITLDDLERARRWRIEKVSEPVSMSLA